MSTIEILYVDDEPDIRTVAVMALELEGDISVRACASGAEALALLQASDWRPTVALLDVMMPEMDGPTLFARLRELPAFAGIPVVFMTARARADDIAQYRALGAAGVIVKPFDPMGLAGEVRKLLATA